MKPLETYEDWKHCIEADCGIPLTLAFVKRRLDELANPRLHHTQRLVEVWGDAHRQQVIAWFERAQRELA